MAEQHNFDGANVHAGPPPGYEEMIDWLHCFHNGRACVSAWKPSPEELDVLNSGGSIFVSVMSGSDERTGRPFIFPMYVGTEETCKEVVSDTGKVW